MNKNKKKFVASLVDKHSGKALYSWTIAFKNDPAKDKKLNMTLMAIEASRLERKLMDEVLKFKWEECI